MYGEEPKTTGMEEPLDMEPRLIDRVLQAYGAHAWLCVEYLKEDQRTYPRTPFEPAFDLARLNVGHWLDVLVHPISESYDAAYGDNAFMCLEKEQEKEREARAEAAKPKQPQTMTGLRFCQAWSPRSAQPYWAQGFVSKLDPEVGHMQIRVPRLGAQSFQYGETKDLFVGAPERFEAARSMGYQTMQSMGWWRLQLPQPDTMAAWGTHTLGERLPPRPYHWRPQGVLAYNPAGNRVGLGSCVVDIHGRNLIVAGTRVWCALYACARCSVHISNTLRCVDHFVNVLGSFLR
jgi:hypothetical protein